MSRGLYYFLKLFRVGLLFLYVSAIDAAVQKFVEIDPVFELYVKTFEQDLARFGCPQKIENISVSLQDLGRVDGSIIGLCLRGLFNRSVSIDRGAWLGASDEERKGLIYHELGHCVLGRGHEDGEFVLTRRAKSLMNSFAVTRWQFDEDYYLEDLFSGCKDLF